MFENKPKILAFGGGTGLSLLLKGLKEYPVDLTAVVTVTDDGGSSGKMRELFKMPPPGDLRKVLVALSRNEDLFDELFSYRFTKENKTGFGGHTIGNIIIAALQNINHGDFSDAISDLSKILNIEGLVIPLSDQQLNLSAEYEDGHIIEGESSIPKYGKRIKRVFVNNSNIVINQEVIDAIHAADMIVFSQGSLYTSLISNLVFDDVKTALAQSSAKVVYVANIMTQKGETIGYDLSDHIEALEKHIGTDIIDAIIYNENTEVPSDVLSRYQLEGAGIVYPNADKLKKFNYEMISSNVLDIDKLGRIRHNYKKVAAYIFSLLLDS